MKKFLGYLAITAISITVIMAFNFPKGEVLVDYVHNSAEPIVIPEDVNAVLNEYCFGCHNTESKNEKGKDKLTLDNLDELSKGKLAAKLNKIAKEIDEGNMPPEKFLAKYPDKDPSKKDKKAVVKWAKTAAKEL